MLDKRYLISKDEQGKLYQFKKQIPIPKPEIIMQAPVEKINQKPDPKNKELEERVSLLERMVIKLTDQINSKK